MISLGGSFAALPVMPARIVTAAPAMAPAMAPAQQIPTSTPIAPMFTPIALPQHPATVLAPDVTHPTLCSSLCPADPLTCLPDGTCRCKSGQICYAPDSTSPPPLYTDSAGHTCPPSAVDANGMCPYLSTGTQPQPYTDPNGVTCYPDQLDGYGYCPGSLQPQPTGGGGGTVTQPPPAVSPPIFVPQPPVAPQPMYTTPATDDGSQYATSQVPAPGSLVPVSTASPYAWSQLSTTAKIAIVLLGLTAAGGGYYWIKRRRRAA